MVTLWRTSNAQSFFPSPSGIMAPSTRLTAFAASWLLRHASCRNAVNSSFFQSSLTSSSIEHAYVVHVGAHQDEEGFYA
jgi:hypothetical protein